jgi:hypothetical protein
MLQAVRLRVRDPMRWRNFFNLPNPLLGLGHFFSYRTPWTGIILSKGHYLGTDNTRRINTLSILNKKLTFKLHWNMQCIWYARFACWRITKRSYCDIGNTINYGKSRVRAFMVSDPKGTHEHATFVHKGPKLFESSYSWRIYIYGDLSLQVRGGLEYLHCSPASHQRRVVRDDLKGTQCPGV